MGRTIGIILALVVIAGGGYYLWQSGALDEAADTAGDAVESAGETAADAVEEAGDAVEETTESATDAAEGAADAVTDAAGEAVDAATDAVEGAVDAVTEGAAEAADTATEAVEGAADALNDAAEGASEAVGGLLDQVTGAGELSQLLTPEGFDADAILTALEGVELPEGVRETVTSAIESARNNPDLVSDAIAQVREALGL